MLTLRFDLDYVPWDTPDANAFGHGEPAMLLRILEIARNSGNRFHFFASNRALRAFPTSGELVLNEGHDLDWLCKHPARNDGRQSEAHSIFRAIGHSFVGLAVRDAWPEKAAIETSEIQFISATGGTSAVPLFEVPHVALRESIRADRSATGWFESARKHVRECAARGRSTTLAIHPQALARVDPTAHSLKELVDFARALDLDVRTLRQRLSLGER